MYKEKLKLFYTGIKCILIILSIIILHSFSSTIPYQASHSLSDNPTRQGNNCRGKGSHSNIVLKVLKWVFETRIRDRTNTLAGCICFSPKIICFNKDDILNVLRVYKIHVNDKYMNWKINCKLKSLKINASYNAMFLSEKIIRIT